MGKYLTEVTKQNAASIYEKNAGVDVPNVTLNKISSNKISYTNNDEIIISYTFTWYDKFIELDEGTSRTWKFGLYDDPTDGKIKYILIDPIDKHIHLLANGESFIWTLRIHTETIKNSNYTFNAYVSLPTSLPSFYTPNVVDYYIPGIYHECYTWESNVEYCMSHAAELGITSVQAEFDALPYDERYTQAENWLKMRGSTFYNACLTYASTPEDQEIYCKICLQGLWRDDSNSSSINRNYRNTELVSCINFITSNIESIRINNIATYLNCSKLIFNDNIETLNGFNAASAYFSYIHLPKHLKNFENTQNGSFSAIKGGGIAYENDYPYLFVDFGDDLENIPNSMFNNTEVIKISMKLPQSLKTIGNSAFLWYNSNEQLIIPASVTSIGNSAFYPGAKVSYTITDRENREFILNDDFRYSSIPSIKFEGNVPPTIGSDNFEKEIDSETPLTILWKEDTGKSYDNYLVNKINATYNIYIPRGSKAAYITAFNVNNNIDESRFIEYDPE